MRRSRRGIRIAGHRVLVEEAKYFIVLPTFVRTPRLIANNAEPLARGRFGVLERSTQMRGAHGYVDASRQGGLNGRVSGLFDEELEVRARARRDYSWRNRPIP